MRPPLLRRPLAALSLASHLSRTWASLGGDKGHVTEADLRAYAAERGLPAAYVQPFLRAALEHAERGALEQQLQHGDDGDATAVEPPSTLLLRDQDDQQQQQQQLSYEAFAGFVRSREAALRKAFDAFDVDGDGRIAFEDVDASLSRVAVCCPTTGCSLRVRHAAACQLLQRLLARDGGGGCGGTVGCGGRSGGGDGCGSTTTATSTSSSGGGGVTYARFREFFLLLPSEASLAEYWLTGSAVSAACCAETAHFSVVDRRRRRGSPWGALWFVCLLLLLSIPHHTPPPKTADPFSQQATSSPAPSRAPRRARRRPRWRPCGWRR